MFQIDVYDSFLTLRCKESYILVGTATGYLQVHSDGGALLHRQRLHTSAVTSIRMRVAGMHISADGASEDVTVCFEDAAACFSSIEVCHLSMLSSSCVKFHLKPGPSMFSVGEESACQIVYVTCTNACFDLFWVCVQLRSLVYIRREVGPSSKWPTLGFNKWDTSRSAGASIGLETTSTW